MVRKLFMFITLFSMSIVIVACGGSKSGSGQNGDDVYEQVMEEERINLSEAYEKLKNIALDDKKQEFVDEIGEMCECGGEFIELSEDGSDVYAADITFYLESGNVKATIDYANYVGSIEDAGVEKSEQEGYIFESHTLGDIVENQKFDIYYSKDKLHIIWGNSSDHVLTRDLESAAKENVEIQQEEQKISEEDNSTTYDFESTDLFQNVVEVIDNNYSNTPHRVYFDQSDSSLKFVFQMPTDTKAVLDQGNSDLLKSWENMVNGMVELDEKIFEIVKTDSNVQSSDMFLVVSLDATDLYDESNCLAWIQNGELKYKYK